SAASGTAWGAGAPKVCAPPPDGSLKASNDSAGASAAKSASGAGSSIARAIVSGSRALPVVISCVGTGPRATQSSTTPASRTGIPRSTRSNLRIDDRSLRSGWLGYACQLGRGCAFGQRLPIDAVDTGVMVRQIGRFGAVQHVKRIVQPGHQLGDVRLDGRRLDLEQLLVDCLVLLGGNRLDRDHGLHYRAQQSVERDRLLARLAREGSRLQAGDDRFTGGVVMRAGPKRIPWQVEQRLHSLYEDCLVVQIGLAHRPD